MRTSKISKLVALSALVCSLGIAPEKVDAAVVLNGCAGGSFGADCGLDELIAGGNFLIGDTRFANFNLALLTNRLLDASAIRVDPIDALYNPGFRLTDTRGTLRASNGLDSITGTTGNELSFNVTMEGGPLRIKDNSLVVEFGEMTNPGIDTYAQISENIFDSNGPIGDKNVICETGLCENGTGSDLAEFAPQTSLLVFANIDVFSAGAGDVAQIIGATLNFSQIPEPATVALFALGVTGIGWSRRGRARG